MSEKRFKTMEEFAEAVSTEFEKRIDKRVMLQKINKNNGVVWYGLTVLEDHFNVSPTIYIEQLYKFYEDVGMEGIMDYVTKMYEENKPKQSIDVNQFLDYEIAKEKLAVKLINYEKNKEMLEDIPHIKFLDLAIVPIIRIEELLFGEGIATITVKNNLQQTWKVDTEEIIKTALANIREETIFGDIVDIMDFDGLENVCDNLWGSMYVISNKVKMFGASAILWTDNLSDFADCIREDTLTILPSSIHECIVLIGDVGGKDLEELRETVKEVNETVVSEQEVLSDNVYIYHRATDEITIAIA